MTPCFPIMGGKARLVDWLLNYFPKTGDRYVELFAGRANAFFAARQELIFRSWELQDLDASFLVALKTADLEDLPTAVRQSDFEFWKQLAEENYPIAKVIEPAITFSGKGYKHGYQSGTNNYHFFEQRAKLQAGQNLLQGCKVSSGHWRSFVFPLYHQKTFVILIHHISGLRPTTLISITLN